MRFDFIILKVDFLLFKKNPNVKCAQIKVMTITKAEICLLNKSEEKRDLHLLYSTLCVCEGCTHGE